jgi:hypothetical protein
VNKPGLEATTLGNVLLGSVVGLAVDADHRQVSSLNVLEGICC